MIYRFGDCELDTTTFELRCGRAARDVQPQVLELLRYLIENRDRMVTKDELFENVWSGRIVSESALSSRIKAARQAIGDDGNAQRLIRTVHGRGFRFVGKLDQSETVAADGGIDTENDAAAGAKPEPGTVERPSIAILPFDNLSGDPEQEYFSDGITEDIISALSKYRWLSVTARNSTFIYKNRSHNVREIAAELGVSYVMEGSVRRAGDRLRISCQLIDARNGSTIWAERYDGELRDIFELQDEITGAIVGAVGPELATAEQDLAKRKVPENLDAWDHYQRGMWHMWRDTRDDGVEALECFRNALALDPESAWVQAGYAWTLVHQILMGWIEPTNTLLDEALGAAKKALEIDERDAFAHFALGRVLTQSGRHSDAVAALERAIELNPNMALAFYGLGTALVWSGEHQRAIPYLDQTLRRSPNDPVRWWLEMWKGMALWLSGQPEEAVDVLERSCRHPNIDFWPLTVVAAVLVELGRIDEAKQAIEQALELRPELTLNMARQSARHMVPGQLTRYLDNLKTAGLPD